jgi:Spy/CpxP family protein refolding chaperone
MRILAAAVIVLVAGPVTAQDHQHKPYSDMQARSVKALSPQQIDDLRAGRGMGMALAAELNGYPGPLHVLELADGLTLSTEQRQQVKALYEAMKVEAIATGEELIEAETELDRLFADKTVTPSRLAAATARVARMQGVLREVHLKYHLTTAQVLSPAQAMRYAELRGYR